ncbi:hypothetical protein Acy02nite_47150 [Actinoplanes cyaneus]|uniref:Uncharacterized protein n=1 Tax=Actinoplanes cyaneus TaxID=52696 RepID=A0A919IJC8_9ACTN|nr:hypothetical protein Acy02nite_47150 [Actinoplanes cyaneus]
MPSGGLDVAEADAGGEHGDDEGVSQHVRVNFGICRYAVSADSLSRGVARAGLFGLTLPLLATPALLRPHANVIPPCDPAGVIVERTGRASAGPFRTRAGVVPVKRTPASTPDQAIVATNRQRQPSVTATVACPPNAAAAPISCPRARSGTPSNGVRRRGHLVEDARTTAAGMPDDLHYPDRLGSIRYRRTW